MKLATQKGSLTVLWSLEIFFVFIEKKSTIKDTNDMKRMLKKAQLLATNDFSTQNNGVKLFTKDKHGVAILAYDLIVNDGEKDIVATTKEIYDFARENKIMLLTRSGQEYGFLNDHDTNDPEIHWCNQPENCDD